MGVIRNLLQNFSRNITAAYRELLSASMKARFSPAHVIGTRRVWDASTGSQTKELPQGSPVLSLALSGNSQMIALGLENGTLRVLDSYTKQVLLEYARDDEKSIKCVSFSPDSSRLAASFDGTIRICNARTWAAENEFQGPDDFVFYPNGKHILSSHTFGILIQWDVKSGKRVEKSSRIDIVVRRIVFTAHGDRIVYGHGGVVRVWDLENRTESKPEIHGYSGGTEEVAICDDGLRVASAWGP